VDLERIENITGVWLGGLKRAEWINTTKCGFKMKPGHTSHPALLPCPRHDL
jgi:hypothetical protein